MLPDVSRGERANERLHAIKASGQELLSTPLPADPAKNTLRPAIVASNHHILVEIHGLPGDPRPGQLLQYAADGNLIGQTEFPLPPDPRAAKMRETALFGALFPQAAKPVCPPWILDNVLDIRSEAFAGIFSGFMHTSAILCGVIILLLGRRYGLKPWQTLAWSAACAFLGPAGVGVFLSVNEQPALERCAACGAMRTIGQGGCSKCGAALMSADFRGHEIFEPDAFQLAGQVLT